MCSYLVLLFFFAATARCGVHLMSVLYAVWQEGVGCNEREGRRGDVGRRKRGASESCLLYVFVLVVFLVRGRGGLGEWNCEMPAGE